MLLCLFLFTSGFVYSQVNKDPSLQNAPALLNSQNLESLLINPEVPGQTDADPLTPSQKNHIRQAIVNEVLLKFFLPAWIGIVLAGLVGIFSWMAFRKRTRKNQEEKKTASSQTESTSGSVTGEPIAHSLPFKSPTRVIPLVLSSESQSSSIPFLGGLANPDPPEESAEVNLPTQIELSKAHLQDSPAPALSQDDVSVWPALRLEERKIKRFHHFESLQKHRQRNSAVENSAHEFLNDSQKEFSSGSVSLPLIKSGAAWAALRTSGKNKRLPLSSRSDLAPHNYKGRKVNQKKVLWAYTSDKVSGSSDNNLNKEPKPSLLVCIFSDHDQTIPSKINGSKKPFSSLFREMGFDVQICTSYRNLSLNTLPGSPSIIIADYQHDSACLHNLETLFFKGVFDPATPVIVYNISATQQMATTTHLTHLSYLPAAFSDQDILLIVSSLFMESETPSRAILQGQIIEEGLSEILQLLALGSKTGILKIDDPAGLNLGAIHFQSGKISHARFADCFGYPACLSILRLKTGKFEFELTDSCLSDVNLDPLLVLLQIAALNDEENYAG